MKEEKMENKIKELLGEELGNLFIKIAKQLEKVDKLEIEIEKIKEKLAIN